MLLREKVKKIWKINKICDLIEKEKLKKKIRNVKVFKIKDNLYIINLYWMKIMPPLKNLGLIKKLYILRIHN